MYTPGKIPTVLNNINRNWVLYPILTRDNVKYRTHNFCQFWRWNFYALLQIAIGMSMLYGMVAGAFATLIAGLDWGFGTGDPVSCFESMGDAFLSVITLSSLGTVVSELLTIPALTGLVVTSIMIVLSPFLVLSLGIVWLASTDKITIRVPGSFKATALYNAKLRVKDKICPAIEYKDE